MTSIQHRFTTNAGRNKQLSTRVITNILYLNTTLSALNTCPVRDMLQVGWQGNAPKVDFGVFYLGVHNVRIQGTSVTTRSPQLAAVLHRKRLFRAFYSFIEEQNFQHHKAITDGHARRSFSWSTVNEGDTSRGACRL
jgi:hypothetical protein